MNPDTVVATVAMVTAALIFVGEVGVLVWWWRCRHIRRAASAESANAT